MRFAVDSRRSSWSRSESRYAQPSSGPIVIRPRRFLNPEERCLRRLLSGNLLQSGCGGSRHTRSNLMVPAAKLGAAVRPASVHAAECVCISTVPVHQLRSVLAGAGKANPSSASICSSVSTTTEAYRCSR